MFVEMASLIIFWLGRSSEECSPVWSGPAWAGLGWSGLVWDGQKREDTGEEYSRGQRHEEATWGQLWRVNVALLLPGDCLVTAWHAGDDLFWIVATAAGGGWAENRGPSAVLSQSAAARPQWGSWRERATVMLGVNEPPRRFHSARRLYITDPYNNWWWLWSLQTSVPISSQLIPCLKALMSSQILNCECTS